MVTPFQTSLDQGLFIDIESVPGANIFSLGATCGPSFRKEANGTRQVADLISELRVVAQSVPFIAGHNIIGHDLPVIDAAFQIPEWKRLPAIDTLYVSPLAFPRNPYHRLIKNDRLVRSSMNHPVRDCDSSKAILLDAIAAFRI
jgi:ATP-dependent DNA helicase RecQ